MHPLYMLRTNVFHTHTSVPVGPSATLFDENLMKILPLSVDIDGKPNGIEGFPFSDQRADAGRWKESRGTLPRVVRARLPDMRNETMTIHQMKSWIAHSSRSIFRYPFTTIFSIMFCKTCAKKAVISLFWKEKCAFLERTLVLGDAAGKRAFLPPEERYHGLVCICGAKNHRKDDDKARSKTAYHGTRYMELTMLIVIVNNQNACTRTKCAYKLTYVRNLALPPTTPGKHVYPILSRTTYWITAACTILKPYF